MKFLLSLSILSLLTSCILEPTPIKGSLPTTPSPPGSPMGPYRVISVHDGDTFTVEKDGAKSSIRLHGIDAPELKQSFGPNAQSELEALVLGRWVALSVKGKSYNRLTAIPILDGESVCLAMTRKGMAWHCPEYDKSPELAEAMAQARKNRIGLWRQVNPRSPKEFRQQKHD